MIVPWLMLSALLPIAAVSAQGGVKASARKLRSAIRAIDVTEESGQRVLAAIDALKKFDGRVSARALLDAVEALDGQVMAVAEGRRHALDAGEPELSLANAMPAIPDTPAPAWAQSPPGRRRRRRGA